MSPSPRSPCPCCRSTTRSCCPAWWSRWTCPTPRCAPPWRPRRPPPRAGRRRGQAAGAAGAADRRRRTPAIGILGTVEQVGRLSDGDPGALIRGRAPRAGSAPAPPGPARRCGSRGPRSRRPCPTESPGTVAELVKEYKALATSWLRKRGAWQVVDRVQQIDDVVQLADNSGYSPFLTTEQKRRAAGDRRPGGPAEAGHPAAARPPRRAGRRRDDRARTSRRAWTSSSASSCCAAAGSRPQGAAPSSTASRRATSPTTTAPASRPPTCRRRCARPRSRRSRSWSGPRDQSPEGGWIRTWLDTVLELPWNERTEDAYDIAGRPARCSTPTTPGLEDVKERITEYLAVRKRRAERGLGRGRRPPRRRGAGAGRPARGRQDLARRVRGARHGPQVRPGRARRRPRRGGDPRPPADVRRRAARPDRPGRSRRPGR